MNYKFYFSCRHNTLLDIRLFQDILKDRILKIYQHSILLKIKLYNDDNTMSSIIKIEVTNAELSAELLVELIRCMYFERYKDLINLINHEKEDYIHANFLVKYFIPFVIIVISCFLPYKCYKVTNDSGSKSLERIIKVKYSTDSLVVKSELNIND